jgi:hypothetical protein
MYVGTYYCNVPSGRELRCRFSENTRGKQRQLESELWRNTYPVASGFVALQGSNLFNIVGELGFFFLLHLGERDVGNVKHTFDLGTDTQCA